MVFLEEADDAAGLEIHVYVIKARSGWEAWDGHDITANWVDITCTNGGANVSYKYSEASWDSLLIGWEGRERVRLTDQS